nr:Photosystem II protein Ycf12 [Meringosphaera mediterranea]
MTIQEFTKGMNLQVIGQLVATSSILLSGPIIILLLALRKGNL